MALLNTVIRVPSLFLDILFPFDISSCYSVLSYHTLVHTPSKALKMSHFLHVFTLCAFTQIASLITCLSPAHL